MQELLINTQAGVLTANFDEIKAELNGQLEIYKKLVFTEDTKKDAKNTVAELRRDKRALETKIKVIKKEYMAPFDAFFMQATALLNMYDEPISYINNQIDAFELKRKQEKQKHIKELYAEMVPEADLQDMIPLAKVYDPRWENATATDKAIKADIMAIKTKLKEGISTIKTFQSEVEEKAIKMFVGNLDLAAALSYITQYENQKREILEKEREKAREEDAERIRAEERAKIQREQQMQAVVEEAKAEAIEAFIPSDTDAATNGYTYLIQLTPESKEKLEMFMDSIGIEYTEMPF